MPLKNIPLSFCYFHTIYLVLQRDTVIKLPVCTVYFTCLHPVSFWCVFRSVQDPKTHFFQLKQTDNKSCFCKFQQCEGYLERSGRVGVHLDQRGNQNHTSKLGGPLTGCQDGDRATLSKKYRMDILKMTCQLSKTTAEVLNGKGEKKTDSCFLLAKHPFKALVDLILSHQHRTRVIRFPPLPPEQFE